MTTSPIRKLFRVLEAGDVRALVGASSLRGMGDVRGDEPRPQ